MCKYTFKNANVEQTSLKEFYRLFRRQLVQLISELFGALKMISSLDRGKFFKICWLIFKHCEVTKCLLLVESYISYFFPD